jgi:transcriptional regulator GlxA family with amidase domain
LCLAIDEVITETAITPYDWVIVPGGEGVHAACEDPRILEWLRQQDKNTSRICSVCTGAFLLAHAGLLDGRSVTTHWEYAARLRKERPKVLMDADQIYCESGKYWTSAGVSAGIDLALALIEREHSSELAQRVARLLVVYLRRSGGQMQYSEPLKVQGRATAPFLALLEQLEKNLAHHWTVAEMAEVSNMSRRTFQRKFVEHFEVAPMELLSRLRAERLSTLPSDSIRAKDLRRWVGGRVPPAKLRG